MSRQTVELNGVCAKEVSFTEKCGHIFDIEFHGGCPGGLATISLLADGRPSFELIRSLKGITCGRKGTSCADQLARAIEDYNIEERLGNANGTD